MSDLLKKALLSTSALRTDRKNTAQMVLSHPKLFKHLLDLVFCGDKLLSQRAAWVLELVCREKIAFIFPQLDYFLNNVGKLQEGSALRPCAKVIQLICEAHYDLKTSSDLLHLPRKRKEQLTELCFDWLIADIDVAPKAYSIYSLYRLGKDFSWIYPALIEQLKKDAPEQSAGYQAAARKILKKIDP